MARWWGLGVSFPFIQTQPRMVIDLGKMTALVAKAQFEASRKSKKVLVTRHKISALENLLRVRERSSKTLHHFPLDISLPLLTEQQFFKNILGS